MERLTGKEIDVHLTCDEVVSGILFDMDDDHIYIQNDVDVFTTIPRNNIKYYVSRVTKVLREQPTSAVIEAAQEIIVCVDGERVGAVTVPSHISMATCNENILELIYANEGVKAAVDNRIQMSIEYDIGYANINTVQGAEEDHPEKLKVHNSFGMGGGSTPATPFEMTKTISRGKCK